jgi:repressor LexA
MLTRKQKELLILIHEHLGAQGIPPSFDEMKESLGLKSKSGIHRLITGLEERGFIRRLPHRARALEILKMPEGFDAANQAAENNIIRPDFTKPAADERNNSIPLYGKIAAGLPIEALANESSFISVPPDLLGRGDYYALEVEGDSMIEAGILDGDTVVIERTHSARNGDIVVALVDNEEVTLKTLQHTGSSVTLEAANRDFEDRVLSADRVSVQGKLSGLLRRY